MDAVSYLRTFWLDMWWWFDTPGWISDDLMAHVGVVVFMSSFTISRLVAWHIEQ